MKILIYILLLAFIGAAVLFGWTRYQVSLIESTYRPIGTIAKFDGRSIHFLDVPASADASLPPVLFVHGASGNLRDQLGAFGEKMSGQARLIFIDRPGHGYSDRGDDPIHDPSKQAAVFKDLLDYLKVDKAVLVGHSMGAASVAAFAVHYPQRVKGLVFLAPATHSWPGGVSWYYELTAIPVIGWLFSEMLALPAGQLRLEEAVRSVFEPNPAPQNYASLSAADLVLRPQQFRANALDVAYLKQHVSALSPRYSEIKAPTSIITGDQDDVVLAEIHSLGLERDIENAKLIIERGVGHKPDYVVTETVINEIRRVSGR